MIAGATNSQEAAAAAAEEARRRAAEQARKAAEEQARREAAAQAERQAEQARQAEQQAQEQSKSDQKQTKPPEPSEAKTEPSQNKETQNKEVQGKSDAQTGEKPPLEKYSERHNIDAKHIQHHFEAKMKANPEAAPTSDAAQAENQSAAQDDSSAENDSSAKNDSSAAQTATEGPGFLRRTFDKALDFAEKAAEHPAVKNFIGKAAETANGAIEQMTAAFKKSSESQKLAAHVGGQTNNQAANREVGEANIQDSPDANQEVAPGSSSANGAQTAEQTAPPEALVEERLLETARRGDAAGAAQMLHDELKNRRTPAERNALLGDQRVGEAVGNTARRLTQKDDRPDDETVQRTLENLSRAAELTDADGANKLARDFSSGVAEDYAKFNPNDLSSQRAALLNGGLGKELADSIKNGAGFAFAANLSHELLRTGKLDAGVAVAEGAQDSLHQIQADFADNAKKVEELSGELGRLVGGFGAALTDEQKQGAVEAFKQKHRAEYDAFENSEATTALISTLDGAQQALDLPKLDIDSSANGADLQVRAQSEDVLKELPRVGQTAKGLEKIADAIEKQGAGQRTFMDLVPDVAKATKDAQGYAKQMTNVAVKATGLRVLQHAEAGNLDKAADTLFKGLVSNRQMARLKQQQHAARSSGAR